MVPAGVARVEIVTSRRATGVKAIVAANPGCTMQLAYGARRRGIDLKVLHVVDLLDRAYGYSATQ